MFIRFKKNRQVEKCGLGSGKIKMHGLERRMFERCKLGNHKATSLIELIVTITIFSAVAVLSTITLINTMQSTKRIQSQVFLYTEAQTLMDQLARTVERNAIDYEAYYDRYVLDGEGWHTETYGYYGQAFYDPGSDGPTSTGPYDSITDYEAECPSDSSLIYPQDCPDESPVYSELDLDTGQHPFDGIVSWGGYESAATDANALCRAESGGGTDCTEWGYSFVNDLILINNAGDERTVFAQELFDGSTEDYFLSKVQLSGEDTDQDGVVDYWSCMDGYTCTADDVNEDADLVPDEDDLESDDDGQVNFMPFTPSAISIEEFYVILSPNEDPYRAFTETDIQIQPYVTMIMTVTLSEDYSGGVLGDTLSITIQRTVSTGVYSEVVSYE